MLTNNQAIGLLRSVSNILSGGTNKTKFNFALVKNMRRLEAIQEDAQKALSKESDSAYDELMQSLNGVKLDFAQLNPNGEPIRHNDGEPFINPARMGEYELKIKEIAATNPDWDAAYKKRQQAVQDVLDADSDFKPYMIKVEDLPEEMHGMDFLQISLLIEGMDDPTTD